MGGVCELFDAGLVGGGEEEGGGGEGGGGGGGGRGGVFSCLFGEGVSKMFELKIKIKIKSIKIKK